MATTESLFDLIIRALYYRVMTVMIKYGAVIMLPDVLSKDLKVVFCGTAVGDKSAERGCYYSGPGNQFWPTLKKLGMIPYSFQIEEFSRLPEYRIGLTDLVKTVSGQDKKLKAGDFDVTAFRAKIERFSPRILAFNGKKAAEVFLGHSADYGLQKEKIGTTEIFVLPSTSGAARGYWDETYWSLLFSVLNG